MDLTSKRDLSGHGLFIWPPEETFLKHTDKFSIISLSATLKDTLRAKISGILSRIC